MVEGHSPIPTETRGSSTSFRKIAHAVVSLREHVQQAPEGLMERYKREREKIKSTYERVADWHGTGRYAYRGNGEVTDVLSSIAQNGLVPKVDTLHPIPGVVGTVSLTQARPYAMIYATLNLAQGQEYVYRYHSQSFWWYRMMLNAASATLKMLPSELKGKRLKEIMSEIPIAKSGMGGVNKNVVKYFAPKFTRQEVSPQRWFEAHSDIEGNYPILVGIEENAYTPVPTAVYLKSHESRSAEPIQRLTHLEVPLAHVEETEAFLRERGSNLPVLPIELGELYSSEFSPKALLEGSAFRNKLSA